MRTKTCVRLLTASILLATALPGLASDKQDRREGFRRQVQYVEVDRNGRYVHSQSGRFDRHADRRMVERPVVRSLSRPVHVERRVAVHRPVRQVVVARPVYVERPVYHQAPVYSNHPYYGSRSVMGALGGAVIGAVIGSQVAHPEHRAAATVAGAVIGGVIGNGL